MSTTPSAPRPPPRSARRWAARSWAWLLLALTLAAVVAVARPPASPAAPSPAATASAAPALPSQAPASLEDPPDRVSPDQLERRLDALEGELAR